MQLGFQTCVLPNPEKEKEKGSLYDAVIISLGKNTQQINKSKLKK